MKYFVQNRVLKGGGYVEANSAQEACEKLGWMIGDCYVEEKKRRQG